MTPQTVYLNKNIRKINKILGAFLYLHSKTNDFLGGNPFDNPMLMIDEANNMIAKELNLPTKLVKDTVDYLVFSAN